MLAGNVAFQRTDTLNTDNDRLKVADLLLFSFGFLLFAINYLISSLGGGLKSCLACPRFPYPSFPQKPLKIWPK